MGLLRGGRLYAVHTDHRNAPLAVTDEARAVVWQASVADYLQASPTQGTSFGRITFNLRGSNQYADAETGLHYNTQRYYDPQAARYLTPDPLGLAVGPDPYAFALGQPHSMADPLGLAPIATDADVANATYGQKLVDVFERAIPKLLADLQQQLKILVDAEHLKTTVAIFALWAGAHAFGAGEVFDVAVGAIGYLLMGKAAVEVIAGFVDVALRINDATTCAALDAAASRLANVLAVGGRSFVEGAALGKLFKGTQSALDNVAPDWLKKLVGDANLLKRLNFGSKLAQLRELTGKPLTGKPITNTASSPKQTTAIGNLGEQAAADLLLAQTGKQFLPIQNASGNGIDLYYIDTVVKKVIHIEVKTSAGGKPGLPKDVDPVKVFTNWVDAAVEGKINKGKLTQGDIDAAKQIKDALGPLGYTLESKVMQVVVPGVGQSGVPAMELRDWLGLNLYSPCMTSVCH